MPFILGLLAVLVAIGVFVIRANRAAQTARDIGEAASEARKFLRRSSWNAQTNTDQIKSIEDPRLAAAVMMCALAKSDADLSESEANAILNQLKGPLALSHTDAEEMLAQARWMTRDMKDLGTLLHRAAPPIQANCNAQEKNKLLDMLLTVSEADGPMDTLQQDAVDRLCHELGIRSR